MNQHNVIRSIIDGQLEKVQKVYPQGRIDAIRKRMDAFWSRSPGQTRIPRVVFGQAPKNLPGIPEGTGEDDRELIVQLQGIIEHGQWDDDFYPALSPGLRQVTIPSYFGCTEEFASASVRVKPAISDPKDVYSLPQVGFGPDTVGGKMLHRIRYWRQMTHGLLSLYEADMQGPFSVASQIWGVQEFLTAIYDSPDEVHVLLQRCTDAVIEYTRLMYEAAEGNLIAYHCMPAIWYPREKGIAVSEDLAAVVSQGMIRGFVRPYLEQIAEAFGGVYMHSCGSLNHVIRELNHVRGLVGLNFSSCETDIGKALQELDPSLFVVSHNSPVNRTDLPLLNPIQHAQACASAFTEHKISGICILIPCTMHLDPDLHSQAIADALSAVLLESC